MKSVFFLGATLALLQSTNALHSHERNFHGQAIIHAGKETDKGTSLSALTENNEPSIPHAIHPPSPQPPTHSPLLIDTEELDNTGDAGPSPHHSHSTKFHVGSSTSQWAITYVPYTDSLTCKTPSSIQTDVATIAQKGFSTIRLYATDCSALKHIGSAAQSHNLRLLIGVHIEDPNVPLYAQPQIDEIITWGAADNGSNWDLIEMIVIGNEAIFNEFCTATSLASFITSARTHLRKAGYKGPLTTTEPINILYENAATLCPTVDIAAANIHPFFHSEVSAEMAGEYVADQLAELERICPGKEAVNLETGWPSRGVPNGEAVPGALEQMLAVSGIEDRAGGRSVFLGFGDDGWKDEGEFGVEGSWGCSHLFGAEVRR